MILLLLTLISTARADYADSLLECQERLQTIEFRMTVILREVEDCDKVKHDKECAIACREHIFPSFDTCFKACTEKKK